MSEFQDSKDHPEADSGDPVSLDPSEPATIAGDGGSGEGAGLPAESPEGALLHARGEAAEFRDRWMRVAADFENFKRRTYREREEWSERAAAEVFEDLLRVRDDFERALAHAPQESADPVLAGVRLVYRHLVEFCERHMVKPMDSLGQPFQPELHEAILEVERDDVTAGTVVDEAVRGYRMGERVLRHAQVVVAKSGAGSAS